MTASVRQSAMGCNGNEDCNQRGVEIRQALIKHTATLFSARLQTGPALGAAEGPSG